MRKFRKKQVVVEAGQFTGDNIGELVAWAGSDALITSESGLIVRTLEGDMTLTGGNWLVRGVRGEFYPVRDDIFRETYTLMRQPRTNPAPVEPSAVSTVLPDGAVELQVPQSKALGKTHRVLLDRAELERLKELGVRVLCILTPQGPIVMTYNKQGLHHGRLDKLVMGVSGRWPVVRHLNGDPLDFRRSNLSIED